LNFAWAEYRRYGLDKISAHQDANLLERIMGLGARLLKDLLLASSGKVAKDYALQSSEKYEAAYQVTGGFYSGINAAAMGLMGGMPGSRLKTPFFCNWLTVRETGSRVELILIASSTKTGGV